MERNLLKEIAFVLWTMTFSYTTAIVSLFYGPFFAGFLGTGMMGLLIVYMIGYYTRIPRVK